MTPDEKKWYRNNPYQLVSSAPEGCANPDGFIQQRSLTDRGGRLIPGLPGTQDKITQQNPDGSISCVMITWTRNGPESSPC